MSERIVERVNLMVSAYQHEGIVQLVDRNGIVLTEPIERSRLGRLPRQEDPRTTRWSRVFKKQLTRMRSRWRAAQQCDPWEIKYKSLAASHRYRGMEINRPKSRRRFEVYNTRSWESAFRRLWQQGNNRFRHVSRTEWDRWYVTVANNHNKRKGGRYAKA